MCHLAAIKRMWFYEHKKLWEEDGQERVGVAKQALAVCTSSYNSRQ